MGLPPREHRTDQMAEGNPDKRLFALMDANKSGDIDEKEFFSFMLALGSSCENNDEKKLILKLIKTIGEMCEGNPDTITWEAWDAHEPPDGRFTEADMALLLEAIEGAEAHQDQLKEVL